MTKRKVPLGVKLIAALAILEGVLEVILAAFTGLMSLVGFPLLGGAVVLLLLGISSVAYGCGLLYLERWAWYWGVVVSFTGVAIRLGSLLSSSFSGVSLLLFLVEAAIFAYLLKPSIRRLFRVKR